MGRELHCKIIKHGLYDRNTVLCTALVDMYAKCGALGKAQQVFDELLVQDVVSWTALISGYCQHQHGEKALACLHKMQQTDLLPNAMTLACILKACSSIGSVNDGRIAHADIIKRGIGRNDNALGVALVDMYAKCGLFSEAKHVFDKLAVQDSSMWNAIITGYCQYGHGHEAVDCYEFMRHGAAKPDEVTYACILKACGSIGALDKGQEIHFEIMRERWLEKFSMLGSALVDMYAKCGALVKAQKVFDKLAIKDAAAWTALIAGYFQRGYGGEALASFEQMLHEGHTPDEAIFSYVLKTCSILAAPEKGQQYFEVMTCYGIIPTLEHHTCIIDLFSRWGQFAKAFEVVTQMPSSDHLPAWLSLLAGCKRWGNLQAARFVFDHVVQLDTKSAVAYLHMSSMYVDAGMQEEAEKIEAMRKEKMYLGGQCITRSLESNVLLG
ncbi:hypothetical protein KP509_10G047400 [Ceratopteris richardii]|nr:hypothetical protein KP509_10G047400 [Ceratopteris richardii]